LGANLGRRRNRVTFLTRLGYIAIKLRRLLVIISHHYLLPHPPQTRANTEHTEHHLGKRLEPTLRHVFFTSSSSTGNTGPSTTTEKK
jgi:hypothetical protein